MLNIHANSNVLYKLYNILGIEESDLAKTLFVYPLQTRATATIKILENRGTIKLVQRRISNFAFKTFPIAQHHEFGFIQKDMKTH